MSPHDTGWFVYLDGQIEERRAELAAARTYGEYWELEDTVAHNLRYIRKAIRDDRIELRSMYRWQARARRRGYRSGYASEQIPRLEARIARSILHRDELAAGLRAIKKENSR